MSTKGTWQPSTEYGTETRLALWIRFENEAMESPLDAAEALREVAQQLDHERYDGTIFDRNGNSVGAWDIEAFNH